MHPVAMVPAAPSASGKAELVPLSGRVWLALLLLTLVVTRVLLVAFIEVSTFPAITGRYLAPAFPLLWLVLVLVLSGLGVSLRSSPST